MKKLYMILGLLILPLNISLEIIFNFIKNLNLKKSLINCLQIFLLLIVLIPMANASLEDNFDRTNNATLGTATNGNTWTETEAGNTLFSILNNNYRAYYSTTASGSSNSQLIFGSSSPTRIDFIDLNLSSSTTTIQDYFMVGNGDLSVSTNQAIMFIVNRGFGIQFYTTAWNTLSTPYTIPFNTKINISLRNINYVTHTYDIYINGVSKHTGAAFRNNLGSSTKVAISITDTVAGGMDLQIGCLTTNGSVCEIATTPTIYSNLSSYYNSFNISVYLNTTSNTNMSYTLNGGGETSICSDCNTSTVNLTGIEGLNNVTWISTDVNGQENTSENFTIDTINPIINTTFPTVINLNNHTLNFTNYINITDNTSTTCSIIVTEFGQSPQSFPNCYNSTFIFSNLGNASLNITATDIVGNTNSEISYINIDLYRVNMTFFSSFSGDPLNQVAVSETILGSLGNSGNNTYLLVYINPGNYTFTITKTSFETTIQNFTKSNITIFENLSISLSSTFTFILEDERTLQPWNLSAATSVILQVICQNQSVIQQDVNSTNFTIDVPCPISKFKFLIDYTTDSYFRSILINESERVRDVYLIDLTTTQSVFNTFTIFDLSSNYINPRLSFRKYVGGTGEGDVEITGDIIDAQGTVPGYFILNDEYILVLTSDNQPTRNIGFYSASSPGDKVLKLFTLNFGVSSTNMFDKVRMNSYIINSTLFGVFNDTTLSTSTATFTVYNVTKYGNIIYSSSMSGSDVGSFSYNIPASQENLTLYTVLTVTNSIDTFVDERPHKQNTNIDLGLVNFNIDLDWVITIFLGFIGLVLVGSTASVGALIIISLGGLFATFGWFTLSWYVIALGMLLSIIKIAKEAEAMK